MSGWTMFWLLVAVFYVGEYRLFRAGYDTILYKYRTQAELEIQARILKDD